MKLVHWPLMGGLLHLVQRGGDLAGPLLAVSNVTAHPSTTSVPITLLLFAVQWISGPLLSGFNMLIKGLIIFSTNLSCNRHKTIVVYQNDEDGTHLIRPGTQSVRPTVCRIRASSSADNLALFATSPQASLEQQRHRPTVVLQCPCPAWDVNYCCCLSICPYVCLSVLFSTYYCWKFEFGGHVSRNKCNGSCHLYVGQWVKGQESCHLQVSGPKVKLIKRGIRSSWSVCRRCFVIVIVRISCLS